MIRDLARFAIREALSHKPVPSYDPAPRTAWLLRPDHLGDLLFLRPGLARFRAMLPDWHITLAVGPWSRAVVEDERNIDSVTEIHYPGFARDGSATPWQPYELLFEEADRLRKQRPAAAVILRDDHWWGGLLARLAGVPVIIGADRPEMRGLLTDCVEPGAGHSVEENIRTLEFAATRIGAASLGRPADPRNDPLRWSVTSEDRERAGALLRDAGISRPYVVIHPGSGAPVKLWPVERWAQVAGAVAKSGFDVVLTGSRAEQPCLGAISSAASARVHSFGGRTSLRELAAVFDAAALVVGVDSGPLHLAVAVGQRTIHIFGPSDTSRYGPWGDPLKHRVIHAGMHCDACGDLGLNRPEGAGCMVAVPASHVIDVVRGMLDA